MIETRGKVRDVDANGPGAEPLEPRILTLLPADGTPVSNAAMQDMLTSELGQPVNPKTFLKACERLAEYRIIGTLPGEIYLLTDVEPRAAAADPSVDGAPEAEITALIEGHREETSQEKIDLAEGANGLAEAPNGLMEAPNGLAEATNGDVTQGTSATQGLAAAPSRQSDGGDLPSVGQNGLFPLDQTTGQRPVTGRLDGSPVPLRRGRQLVLALGVVLALGTILLFLTRERAAERNPQPPTVVDLAPLSNAGLSNPVDARPQPTPGAPQRADEPPSSPAVPEQAVELGRRAPLPTLLPSDPSPVVPNVSETPSPPGPAPIQAILPKPAPEPKPRQASPPPKPSPKLQAKRKPDSKPKPPAKPSPKPRLKAGAERKP